MPVSGLLSDKSFINMPLSCGWLGDIKHIAHYFFRQTSLWPSPGESGADDDDDDK